MDKRILTWGISVKDIQERIEELKQEPPGFAKTLKVVELIESIEATGPRQQPPAGNVCAQPPARQEQKPL